MTPSAEVRPRELPGSARAGAELGRLLPLALLAILGAGAGAVGASWGEALLFLALCPLLLGAAWSWWGARRLRVERDPVTARPRAGAVCRQRFRVENRSGLPLPLVEVGDRCGLPAVAPIRQLRLPRGRRLSWESNLYPSRRGSFQLGPTELWVSDPLRIFRSRLLVPASSSLTVLPPELEIPDPVLAPTARGTAVAGGMAAAPGRPLRRRTDPRPRGGAVLLLLDLTARPRPGAHRADLELELSLAAAVAESAREHGRRLSLAASDRRLGRFVGARGEEQFRGLLGYLSSARADGEVEFSSLVRSELARWRERGRVVLISSDPRPEWLEAVAGASRADNRALAILVGGAGPGSEAGWRLVLDVWQVRRPEDLARLRQAAG